MRLVNFFNEIEKQEIDESYVTAVVGETDDDMHDLIKLFAEHGKLSGNITEDTTYLQEFSNLMEEDEFDPYSHLQATDMIDVDKDCILTLNRGNDKLQKLDIVYLSLPAGYACPFADICKSMAHKKGGRFKDSGRAIKDFGSIRCFAATAEVAYPAVRKLRWRNFDLLRVFKGDVNGMAELIEKSIKYYEQEKPKIKVFRIHDSGDFYSQDYFDAWLKVAANRTDILFYAYTKALPFWQARKNEIPKNLRLIASEGGTMDELIDKEQFRKAVIVQDKGEAIKRRLNIDVNDFLAAFGDQDFAMLLHGTQSKEGGNTRQARANSKTIKDAASRLHVDPKEIDRLFRSYTSASVPVDFQTQRLPVQDEAATGTAPNVGDGAEGEIGATWAQADKPHGYS